LPTQKSQNIKSPLFCTRSRFDTGGGLGRELGLVFGFGFGFGFKKNPFILAGGPGCLCFAWFVLIWLRCYGVTGCFVLVVWVAC